MRVLCMAAGVAPADLLLLMAASENDAPKVAELLRAGADTTAQVTSCLVVIFNF